ncbi:MAG: hypothetical protein JWM78_3467 [Verrucomicrobiaceae bacterium]|nr:hypothetical protein [Verrucomicrobiaceae bacterium]
MTMKNVLLKTGALAACALLLHACGGDGGSHHSPPPAAATTQTYDTAQVQKLTETSSETADPIQVNDGKATLGDDDTNPPATVNAQ